MRRFGATVGVLASLLLSCGTGVAARPAPRWARALPDELPLEGALRVRPDELEEPALELRFPWRNPEASFGYGAVHLWARPALDHVRVSAILDAPADARRWRGCEAVRVAADGERHALRARYVGRPLGGGSYEAVKVRFGIHQLRALARAERPRIRVCGDAFDLERAQQATLQRFVEWFDHIATPRRPDAAPFFRDVGPRPALPGEVHDPGPADG